jgi:sialic acid synthase SpsE
VLSEGPRVRLGDRTVGAGEPVLVIAEIGLNHNGYMGLALELIDLAAAAGADAVKFQKREVDRCFTRAALELPYPGRNSFGATYGDHKRALELSAADFERLAAHSRARGLTLLVTPFDEASADLVERLGCPAVKIASHNLTNLPLLEHVARMRRPLLLSTGMADMEEVEAAVATVRRYHDELVLLQCTSAYPASVGELNLNVLTTFREKFGCVVGYSAHEPDEETVYAAVALGACVVEKHFTKDRTLRGPDHAASLEPAELARVIRGIRTVSAALGSRDKRVMAGERSNRDKHHRSLVTVVDVPAGASIERAMLTTKAPGTGLAPARLDEIVGRCARVAIAADTTLTEDLLA